jgi:hypothetical protein
MFLRLARLTRVGNGSHAGHAPRADRFGDRILSNRRQRLSLQTRPMSRSYMSAV